MDAFRGRGQASSGRHDVGHKGVATGCGVPSLYSYVTPAGFRASRMLVTKALSHDVTILAFVPLSLIPLEALLCIESEAADALATLHSMCFSL